MQRAISILTFMGMAAITGVSAHAACGGGGYKPATVAVKAHEVAYTTKSEEANPKLEGVQRDLDKAQLKFDNCQGDCDKERRKLDDAKAKYAKKAGAA